MLVFLVVHAADNSCVFSVIICVCLCVSMC
jgi:hypothetical protein